MPWLHRISLDGDPERSELPATGQVELETRRRKPNPAGFKQPKANPSLRCVDGVWTSRDFELMSGARAATAPPAGPARLEHGATVDAGARAYVFLDRPEHRNPELEAAACALPSELDRWATWLESVGDPYAAPLRRMMSGHEYGPGRERWWLEGIDRGVASIGAQFEMQGGFLRHADLLGGTLPLDLLIHHLAGLRVARGLETLTVLMPRFVAASSWRSLAEAAFWADAPWPATFRELRLECGRSSRDSRFLVDAVAAALPGIRVTS